MPIKLKPGARLFSAVDTTEMIIVKAAADEVDVTIGGAEPLTDAAGRTNAGATAGHDGGAAMGKRYVDETESIELLCTKPGPGVPAVNGVVMHIKDAKALPASD